MSCGLWLGLLGDYPNEKLVDAAWHKCVMENKALIENEIDLLSLNQRKLLISIAQFGSIEKPTSQKFSQKIGMSSTSISQALSKLIVEDFLKD